MDIIELRRHIDEVDRQLMELFVRRMEISAQIADYKKENDLPVFDPAREREKMRAIAETVPPESESAAKVLYSLLAELSRSCQSAKNATATPLFVRISDAIEQTDKFFPSCAAIACLSSQATQVQGFLARTFRAENAFPFDSAQAVFAAVAQEMCRYGLVRADAQIYELLISHSFYIVRSVRICDENGKTHTFLLFSRKLEIYPGADRTCLMMQLPNSPGSLYRVLARLYTRGVNICKLDSRRKSADAREMQFLFELETSVYSPEFVHLICELDDLCTDFRYLGSFTEVT